jgi:hypothetical protein
LQEKALAKKRLFWFFLKRWLVCWQKPNVPFVRLAKIGFKNVRREKIKNILVVPSYFV